MLSALLLAGLLAVPLATAALFLPASGRALTAERVAVRSVRLAITLSYTAVLEVLVVAILIWIGVTSANLVAAAIGLGLASLFWLPVTQRWGPRAHLCWAATTYVFAVYLVFMLWWTFASHLGVAGTIGA